MASLTGASRSSLHAAPACVCRAHNRPSTSGRIAERPHVWRQGRAAVTHAASFSLAMPLSGSSSSLPAGADSVGNAQPASRPSTSADPSSSGENVTVIRTPEQLSQHLASEPDKLTILMCKAIGCRPCKMFARKYQRVASTFTDCHFLEVTGDETTQLRKLMIQMGVRATPTFRIYRQGECVKTHVGIDEKKLRDAVKACLREDEAGFETDSSAA